MRKIHAARSQHPRFVRLFATAALVATLMAGYVGVRVAPTLHSSEMRLAPSAQLADSCVSSTIHC
jgi:hypothetical protein